MSGPLHRRKVLCYIRQSLTRTKQDSMSPERQKKYIETYLKAHPELEPIWFIDAEGHRSGRNVEGRPEFQLLLEYLINHDDIELILVADHSRLSRSVFTSAQMIDLLKKRRSRLVWAYNQEEADLQTPAGRMRLHVESVMNEFYADYVSLMQSIKIATDREAGRWVGGFPFATYQRKRRLQPVKRGAWLMPNGSFLAGKIGQSPAENALFRPYFDVLKKTYELYSTGVMGADKVALQLNDEGYPFEDIHGQPRPLNRDDVRRMVADWPAYGGYYKIGRASDRSGANDLDPDSIALNAQKAVLDLELVRLVAYWRRQRGHSSSEQSDPAINLDPTITSDHGIVSKACPLPLAQVTRCAACELKAIRLGNRVYRSRLGGTRQSSGGRLRHPSDRRCDYHVHSVSQEVIESLFEALLTRMQPQGAGFDAIDTNATLLDAEAIMESQNTPSDEQARLNRLARIRERLRRVERQYAGLAVDEKTYNAQKSDLLAQIADLESQVTDAPAVPVTLTDYMILFRNPAELWRNMDTAGRRALAHGLFDFLLYDFDAQQFTDWQLSAWAKQLFWLDPPTNQ